MHQRAVEEAPPGFDEMGLSPTMLRALEKVGYHTPSPIQAAFIPEALDGYDVLGQAKTGTGKTAAFAIPLIEMLEARGRGPQGIILAPTRELVQQIVAESQRLASGTDVSICGIYGGEPIEKQLRALTRGVDIVVGTPGRVIDHIERKTLYLGDIMHVVLDEADRMLDIGFRPDIERILRRVPDPHQTLLLSATISPDIRKLAQRYMYQPVEMNLSTDEPSVETIKQHYITVDHDRKIELLLHLLERDQPRQCIVFTRTKRGADKLAERHQRPGQGCRDDPRRPRPDRPQPRHARLPRRHDPRPGRHRRRRPRHRRQRHQPRHQLRHPRRPRELPAPDRPDRPDGQGRHRLHLRRPRPGRAPDGHRAADQQDDPRPEARRLRKRHRREAKREGNFREIYSTTRTRSAFGSVIG